MWKHRVLPPPRSNARAIFAVFFFNLVLKTNKWIWYFQYETDKNTTRETKIINNAFPTFFSHTLKSLAVVCYWFLSFLSAPATNLTFFWFFLQDRLITIRLALHLWMHLRGSWTQHIFAIIIWNLADKTPSSQSFVSSLANSPTPLNFCLALVMLIRYRCCDCFTSYHYIVLLNIAFFLLFSPLCFNLCFTLYMHDEALSHFSASTTALFC